jgi:3-hydroxyacyl-CoA dehydrogenase
VLLRLKDGKQSFYAGKNTESPYILLDRATAAAPPVAENEAAALLDIGDDVLCLEFRSKGNAISAQTIEMIDIAVEEMARGRAGLVIGNQGAHFSFGADLSLILEKIDRKAWDELAAEVTLLQDAASALKYAPKPVVSAAFGMTLGGGAEIAMQSRANVFSVATCMGLVETGVGLVPGGGGCKEMLAGITARATGASKAELLPAVKELWRNIAGAKVSANAFDAVKKGFAKPDTRIVMNPDRLIDEAKSKALELSKPDYMPPATQGVLVLGDFGYGALMIELEAMRGGGFVSEYDAHIARRLAYILTGGDAVSVSSVSESYLRELEKEVFLSLCGEEKTRLRIEHMLKTGKPLRN